MRKTLLEVVEDFYSDLDIEKTIIDIQLTGSLDNFNWTRHSDLDVHILIDFSEIGVEIKKHDIELYAQDVKEPHISTELYSLKNVEWITKPKFKPRN